MPRPSLKSERRAQILNAYGRCIARLGVEGATLEQVADEAGLARALIRHNVGNRDALLEVFSTEFVARSQAETEAMIAQLPGTDRPRILIDWLFDPGFEDHQQVRIANALLAAAAGAPELAARMRAWTEHFIDALEPVFGDRVAAVGVAGLYFNVEAMAPLAQIDRLRAQSKTAARRLAGVEPDGEG